jgi:hypothetical protein
MLQYIPAELKVAVVREFFVAFAGIAFHTIISLYNQTLLLKKLDHVSKKMLKLAFSNLNFVYSQLCAIVK